MTKIMNYTPHDVVVMNENKEVLQTLESVSVARCTVKQADAGDVFGIPVVKQEYGEVEGLPEEKDGVFYIVSFLVQDALPNRKDLLVPANLVRDEKGAVIGCTAFSIKNK